MCVRSEYRYSGDSDTEVPERPYKPVPPGTSLHRDVLKVSHLQWKLGENLVSNCFSAEMFVVVPHNDFPSRPAVSPLLWEELRKWLYP